MAADSKGLGILSKRQYIISKIKLDISEMDEVSLSCGAFLYVGRGLRIRTLQDKQGNKYVILGNVYLCDVTGLSVEDCVSEFEGGDLNELIYYWTGKFVIIRNNEIQTDAGGLMPVFYTEDKDWCLSSSLAVIKRIKHIESSSKVSQTGIEWHFMPDTICEGIKGLICTQKVEICSGRLNIVFNPWVIDKRSITTSDKIQQISELLKNALCNIYKYSGKEIWIALTAGKDSRLVLASAISAGIKFNTYTFEHSNISSCDKKIPVQISKDLSFPHKYFKKSKFSREKYDLYDDFTAGNSRGADQLFYACGQFDKIPGGSIIIRSGIFEAGQKYARSIAGADIKSFEEGISDYYASSLSDERQKSSFKLWLEYIKEHPLENIDIRDRMYLEQRVGGWVSAIEQSLDLTDCESLQIANCRALITLLLSATEEERNNLQLSYKTIEHIDSRLSSYPYNETSYMDKLRLIKNVLFTPAQLKRYLRRHLF